MMLHMRFFTLIFFCLALVITSFSQTGPGGVEKNDGTSHLQVWLKPSGFLNGGGTQALNGETVQTWLNSSGYGNNATTDIGAGNNFLGAPLDSTVAFFNGYPAVEFDGDFPGKDGFFLDNIIDDPNEATVFIVLAGGDFVNNVGVFVAHPDGQANSTAAGQKSIGVWVQGDRTLWGRFIQNNGTQRSFSSVNGIDVISNDPLIVVNHADGVNTLSQYANGAISGSTITYDGTIREYVDLKIGRQADEEFDGWIAEVIVFNKALNDAERIIVDNYLAAKYGIDDLTNDYYAFSNSHPNEVSGIGQINSTTKESAVSSEILGIGVDAADLDDGDFVFFGHDGGAIDNWIVTEQPLADTNFVRLEREWVVDITGTPGVATISIDTTLLPAKPAAFDFYYLWLDADGDFTSGATPYLLSAVTDSSIYQATGLNLEDGIYASISLHRSVINFSPTVFNGFETNGASTADFQVQIPYAVYRDVVIDYELSGTSTYNDNNPAIASPATVTILAGNTSETISIAMNGDADDESDETIVLDLDGSTGLLAVAGADSIATYTINDDDGGDPTVQFDAPFSYGFKKTITIDPNMVSGSSDLENFPILINVVDADLATSGNGGKVSNSNGYDIRFTYENSVSWLAHDIEFYDETDGTYTAWVNLPVLSATENTVIEMYYGNVDVSVDPSSATVWNDYYGVYPLGNDDLSDASANGYNGTGLGGGTSDATGIAGRSQFFDNATDDRIELAGFPNLGDESVGTDNQFTISAWVYIPTLTGFGTGRIFSDDVNNTDGYAISVGDNVAGQVRSYTRNFAGAGIINGTETLTINEWHQVVLVVDRDNQDRIIYLDGASSNSDLSDVGTWLSDAGPAAIGGEGTGGELNTFGGRIDHVTITNGVRNEHWIATEYNMIDTVTNYYSISSEEALSGFQISEATDTLAFTVAVSAVDASDITVNYSITGGTAQADDDYVALAGTATVLAGQLSTSFTLDLNNDVLDEENETIVLSLSSPSANANLGANNEITITLIDDDNGPVLSFADTLVSVNEGSSSNRLALNLDAASGTNVTVDYTVTGETATPGSDYVFANGTVAISAGNTTGAITFNVIDDEEIETPEVFSVKLSNSTNASIDLDYDSAVVTINDNDNFGIDGPGGVGKVDGTGTLVMWSIADSVQTTGSNVDLWPNEVGISELDLAPFGTSPVRVDNARNGHDEISFGTGVNDAVRTSELSASYFPYNEATTFTITRHDNRSLRASTYATDTNTSGGIGTNRFSTHIPWNGVYYFDIGQCCTTSRVQGTYELGWEGQYGIFTFRAGESEGKEVWRNNESIASNAGTDAFFNHPNYRFYLGHSTNDDFSGDILEFIMFTSPLNDAQVNIVNNYLAAKYNLAIENDLFAFNTTHSFDVVGIGYEDASNFHVAAKANLVTLSNASDLGTGDYVFTGHNNQLKDTWRTSEIPTGFDSLRRVQREWRFDVTGSPGTISVAIDTAKLPAKPAGYADYILMVDSDGDFSSDATIYSTSLVDGEYVANDVEIAQGDYMSIGILIRKISFANTAINTPETASNSFAITLNQSYVEDIVLDYAVKSATATQGDDYSLANTGTIIITAGSTSATLNPNVIDESEIESDEDIVFVLRNAPNGTFLGTDSIFTYTITDDDNFRDIDFRSPCEYGFSKTINISGLLVDDADGADLTNYPLLVSLTDPHLATTGNGGNVTSSTGYDIAFTYRDSLIWLDHEIESYDPATGEYNAWVKIPTLNYEDDTDTELTIHYGNSNITSDPSLASVWSEYLGVWHFDGDVDDSSPNVHNGTNNGTLSTAGQIGNGREFDSNGNDFIELATFPNLSDDFTITAFVNPSADEQGQRIFIDDDNNSQGYALSLFDGNTVGRVRFFSRGAGNVVVDNNGTGISSASGWHYVAGAVDVEGSGGAGSRSIYVDGAFGVSGANNNAGWGSDAGSAAIGGETLSGEVNNRFEGQMDEVRVYNGVLSAARIATEYANYNDPTSFYSLSLQDTTQGCFVAENQAGNIEVTVSIQPTDNSSPTTAEYTATGGTAINGEDYTLATGTVTIPAGEQSATFEFPLINDLSDEADETIEITISNPSSNTKIGTNSTITFTIQDDDGLPTISFIDTVSTANEGSSLVRIPVQLDIASGNTASVDYEVKSSTATPGVDFTALAGTLEITAGNLTNTISFQPIDDPNIEPVETVEIRLFNPQNAVLSTGSDTLHLVRIKDNDDLGFEGPGGVGDVLNAGGENLLKLWLIADEATANGSNQVTSWSNKIQNISVDYTMIPASGNPNLVTNAINGRSVVSFEDTQDALVSTGALSVASFPGNELSIFVVTETDNLSQISYAYATDDEEANTVETNSISASIPNNGNVEFNLAGDIETAVYQGSWIGNASIFTHLVSSDTFLVRRNNNTIANDNSAGNNLTNHTNFNFYLGKSSSVSDHFQGDIAEVIMFSRELNLAQVNIVNNYLAARYDLAITTDLYNFNVTHGNEVAGIGREDIDNQHVAARAGILTLSNASDLGDGDYVLFGHDAGDVANWSSDEIPLSGVLRTGREWRVDTTGTPGTVTIAIDTTLLPIKPVGNEDYIIVVDADGDFTSGASIVSTTLVDNEYKASDIALNSGDYFTIGIATRTVSFELVADNGFEDEATNVQVNLSLESPERIDLDYIIKDGTATGGNVDYSLAASGTLSFFAGQTTTNIPLGIINDAVLESDETIVIALRNPPSGVNLGADSVHTYTINDDDNFRKVQFAIDTITNAESVDSVYLVVEVDPVDASNETTVLMKITGGTAEASPAPDYTFAVDTIKIQPNETRDSLLVVIIDDVLFEGTESLIFSLSGATNAGLGDTTELVYQITDNDTQVVASFQDTTITVDEGASIASIVVELDNLSGQDIVVDYVVDVAKSTATRGGTDYSLTDGSVTIAAGSEFATINVALTDDDIEESNERITIGISGDNVALNQADTVVITIADNDALSGYYGPGGVGNSENNLLWLDAYHVNGRGVANPTDLDAVPTWKDNSGNGYVFNATSGTEAQQPTWDSDVLNGAYPSITISNSQFGFEAPDGFTNSLSNYTMLTVARQFSGNYMVETNTTGNGVFGLNLSTGGLYTFGGAVQATGNLSTVANLTAWQFDELETNTAEIFRNGTSVFTNSGFNSMSISNNFSIGNRYDGASQATTDFRGRISEVIIYNNPINLAQRIIVENYLAAKYGLTISNDLYDYQGIFFHDVVGIGSTASEGQHLEAMSDSLLLISNPVALDSGEFVFTGHDNGSKSTWTTFEAPLSGSNVRRIAREWRVDIVGDPGDFSFKVDVDRLPAPENGFTQYAIYVDADGDFNNGADIYQLDFSPTSGLYVTDQVTINVGDYVTIGVLKPVIEFRLVASDSTESFTNPKIEVALNFTRDENVTVAYESTGGTAIGANVDYLLSDGTLIIAPGNLLADIDLGIINDAIVEPSETIEITLANPSSNISLGTNVVHTYTINDDDSDRRFDFNTADFSVAEDAVDQTIQIDLLAEADDSPVISDGTDYVFVSIQSESTATFETDYDTLGNFIIDTLYVPNGASSVTFDLQLVDDGDFESSETVVFRLSGGNANIGDNNQIVVTITDNDTEPTVQFTETEAFGQESVSPVQIDVELSASSGATTTVAYAVSSTNATAGTDFDLSDGTITFNPGETETSILLTVNDDGLQEPGEVVTITLSSPDNATLGTNTTFNYTILDNDNLGGTGPGGVGNSTNNVLWLRADYYDGTTTWLDSSRNNYDASVINTPTLNASNGNFNSKPTVTFDGSTDAFNIDPFTSESSDYDVFMVYETSSISAQEIVASQGGLVLGHELGFGYTDDAGNQGTEFTGTAASIYQYSLQSGGGNAVMRVNGTDDNTSTYTQTDITSSTFIGSSTGATNHFNGDLAEVIFYNSTLNSAQRKIVETYLGERYGIANANDLYDNPGFTDDVAGIGRDNLTSTHTQATSANQLTIKNANSLSSSDATDDGDFMLFGHNDGTTTDWDPTANPGIIRLRREWSFDVDGTPGSVTIELDLSAFDTTATRTAFPTLTLLVSSSGDFDADVDRLYSLNLVSGTTYQVNGVVLNDNDVLTLGAVRNVSSGGGTLDFSDVASWVTGIIPGSGDDVFISGTDSVYLSQDVAIGSVTVETGGVLFLNGFKLELDQSCITLNGTGRVNTTPGEVEYSRAGDQCVTCLFYDDVTFSSSGRKFMLDSIIVTGDLRIADNVVELDTDGFDIYFGGNWTNQGTFTPDNGLVIINGSSDQLIQATGAGGESFFKVAVNKPSGRVLLNSSVSVADSLDLTSGIVNLQTNDLTFENTEADHLNGSSSSYFQVDGAGELFFSIAAGETYDLPIGDSDDYSPASFVINSLTGTSPAISINLRDSKYPDISTDFSHITRYWIFNDVNVTAINYDWIFTYTNADVTGGLEGALEPIKFDGARVDDILDFPNFSINAGANRITWENLTSFSSGSAGVEEGGVPLPIELLFFEAISNGDGAVVVNWATSTETNNDYFTIEKSFNSLDFDEVAQIQGAGTVNEERRYTYLDVKPYFGVSYYRLKQTDFDGVVSYSEIVRVSMFEGDLGKPEIQLYPNPAPLEEGVTLSMNKLIPGDIVSTSIIAIDGTVILEKNFIVDQSGRLDHKFELLTNIARGNYILSIQYQGRVDYRRVIFR